MTGNARALILILFGLLALAGCEPQISNTGYTGTWSRDELNGSSIVAIVARGDSYLFRWGRQSDDGRLRVRCDWDGNCEEHYDGEQVAGYHFRSWIEEATGHLRVECRGEIFGESAEEVHYIDELVVRDEGLRLVSRNIEDRGKRFPPKQRGKRSFAKLSDAVVDPPGAR